MELIILFSPLLGAIVGGFFWRSIGESQAIYLTIALLFLSCFLSWIVFFSHGAHVEKITLTSEENQVAVRAAKILGLTIAGVDLMRSNRGPLILEVNSSPGLQGIESCTKTDVARQMITFIERKS